jgi:Protein of unknown function (DUF3761)
MDQTPTPISPKKKSKRLGLILGGVIIAGAIIGVTVASNSSTLPKMATLATPTTTVASAATSAATAHTTEVVSAPSQTANAYQEAPVPQTAVLSNNNTYVNSDGATVHSPAYANTVPAGASAQCRDGSYSFSKHRSGTCSRHGGVAVWL